MTAPYRIASSAVVPAAPEAAFDAVLAAPLEELFPARAGLIPAVRETRGQDGPWGTTGQTRTVVLADGGTNHETLISADRPQLYRYRLDDFTGPFRLIVSSVDGAFSFTPESGGTRVTWTWSLHATSGATRLLLPVLAFFWRRYAAKMWPLYAARLAT